MKLFWTPASPFTRKVVVAAKELGLWERIEVQPTVWPLDWGYATVTFTPGLAEANPVARIPTLVTDDGVPLGDVAVLYHTNLCGDELREACRAKSIAVATPICPTPAACILDLGHVVAMLRVVVDPHLDTRHLRLEPRAFSDVDRASRLCKAPSYDRSHHQRSLPA